MPNFPFVKPKITRAWDGTWLFHVRCPFCGRLHTHGGGNGEQPSNYGHRVSHCGEHAEGGTYIIVPK